MSTTGSLLSHSVVGYNSLAASGCSAKKSRPVPKLRGKVICHVSHKGLIRQIQKLNRRLDSGKGSIYGIASIKRCVLVRFSHPETGNENTEISNEAENNDPSAVDMETENVGSAPSLYDTDLGKLVRSVIQVVNGSPLHSESNQKLKKPLQRFFSAFVKKLDGTAPVLDDVKRRKLMDTLRTAEADFFQLTGQLGKYLIIIVLTVAILASGFELQDGDTYQEKLLWFSWFSGIVAGLMIGSNLVLESRAKSGPRNVVITGSTRGLGKALAREFLRSGDNVVVASRNPKSVDAALAELKEELQKPHSIMGWGIGNSNSKVKVFGTTCDVSKSKDVEALGEFALKQLGSIDIWINNAGVNKGFRPFVDFSDEEINQIVSTNLIGSMICTREAISIMKSQSKKGHVFNMDGAGSDGASTPLTAVYGASKGGLRQLHESLLKECKRSHVGIHTASPGMVLTDLLLSGASIQNKKMFNLICEQPETVARALVPKMRMVKGTGKAVNYLTPPRIILAIITAWLRRGRWFDEEGRAVYAAEADRLRMWAEERQRSDIAEAMEMIPSSAWVSLFSSSIICAYIILSNSENLPGT